MAQECFVVKARGLPWSATAAEVVSFFSDVNLTRGEASVHFTTTKEGRPSGECFVEVCTQADVQTALGHDNEHMGKRYIEVQEAKQSQMEWVVTRQDEAAPQEEAVVRLRGLPYDCTKHDIADFFNGLDICPYGITMTMNQEGRSSGDAYVEFATTGDAERAQEKHKQKIGHRYIEIFRSTKGDIKYVVGGNADQQRPSLMNSRPGPYDRPPNFAGRARGRGGMNLGPSGFNNSPQFNAGGGYDGGRNRKGPMGPHRGGRMSAPPVGNKSVSVMNSKTGHSVHMRGLPFEASVTDVSQFFSPLNAVDIRLLFEPSGRPKGECDVDFATHSDAESAMNKDKQNMGHRYIELFLKSTQTGNAGAGGGWNNGNSMLTQRRNNMDSYGGGYGSGGPNNYNNNNQGFNNNNNMNYNQPPQHQPPPQQHQPQQYQPQQQQSYGNYQNSNFV